MDEFVYFGSHRAGPGIGFSLAHFDSDTGVLTTPQFLLEARAPAFFILHPDGRHLEPAIRAVPAELPPTKSIRIPARCGSSTASWPEGGTPASSAWTGRAATRWWQIMTAETWPCSPSGPTAAWATGPAFDQHTGHGVNPKRQSHAFAHSIILDPTNQFALVGDLGLDRLFVYRFDARDGSLRPNDPPYVAIAPGAGARHARFHPNGRWVYLNTEITSTVIAFHWDSGDRAAGAISDRLVPLPPDFQGTSAASEMEVHPTGRFLYVSNRGHDSLAVLAIAPDTGRLTLIQNAPPAAARRPAILRSTAPAAGSSAPTTIATTRSCSASTRPPAGSPRPVRRCGCRSVLRTVPACGAVGRTRRRAAGSRRDSKPSGPPRARSLAGVRAPDVGRDAVEAGAGAKGERLPVRAAAA